MDLDEHIRTVKEYIDLLEKQNYIKITNVTEEKKETPILDIGMIRNLHKSKVFGFLKGLKESGVEIKCDEEFFTEINSDKIKVEGIKLKIDKEN